MEWHHGGFHLYTSINHTHTLQADASLVPGLVVLSSSDTDTDTAAYLLSPPLLALLGAGSSNNADAAATVANLPPGSRVLLHALDLVHKGGGGNVVNGKRRRALPHLVRGLRAALPPPVLRAAVGHKGEGKGEDAEEGELRAWVVRAAQAMPLLRVEEGEGQGEECWLALA